ncbi:unnamed protein product, partial [Amoebophrya sp. A120]
KRQHVCHRVRHCTTLRIWAPWPPWSTTEIKKRRGASRASPGERSGAGERSGTGSATRGGEAPS